MAPRFKVTVARRCEPRVKTLRGEAKKRDWRMHLVFGDQDEIVISWVGRHTEDEAVHVDGARDIPGLSGIGRARDRQPQCCETFDDPPADPDLVRLVNQIRPTRSRHPRDRTT